MSLSSFYKDMECWIDGPSKEHPCFTDQHGLCENLELWLSRQYEMDWEDVVNIRRELKDHFISRGLDSNYPFNGGDRLSYKDDFLNGTMYQNPKRLEWIRKWASS